MEISDGVEFNSQIENVLVVAMEITVTADPAGNGLADLLVVDQFFRRHPCDRCRRANAVSGLFWSNSI